MRFQAPHSDKGVAFDLWIKRGFDTLDTTSDAFAEANAIDPVWVRSMIAGEPVVPDIGSLCALARGFDYSEPELAADGVRYQLTVQERMAPSSEH